MRHLVQAAWLAAEIGGPVVIKIVSPEIIHKADAGGVVLDIVGPSATKHAAAAMLERVARHHPEAHLEGVTVQPMIQRPGAYELLLGVMLDQQFGPVIVFSYGAMAMDVWDDVTYRVVPLTGRDARRMVQEPVAAKRLLGGYGEAPSPDPTHIAAAVGTPVVVLYALTNPQHTPWGVPSRVLHHEVPCAFCYRSVCGVEGHPCLDRVTPAEIVIAARELMDQYGARKRAGAGVWSVSLIDTVTNRAVR